MTQRDLTLIISNMHTIAGIIDTIVVSNTHEVKGEKLLLTNPTGMKDIAEGIRGWADKLLELSSQDEVFVE